MRDGLFDTIISVLPTIGKIVGGLLAGLEIDGSYMGFLGSSSSETEIDRATFTVDNGRIYLYNTDTDSESAVAFSTDTVNGVSDTAIIPGFCKLDMTSVFEQAAANGTENIALSASNRMGSNGIVILTTGKNISFKEKSFFLGNFLKIEVDDTQRSNGSPLTLNFYSSVPDYKLEEIVSLNITGTNYEYKTLYPPYREISESGMGVSVDNQISPDNVYDIRLQIRISQQGNLLRDSRNEVITEQDIENLKMRRKNKEVQNG